MNPHEYCRHSKQDDNDQPEERLIPNSQNQKMDRQDKQKSTEVNCQIDRAPMVACDLFGDDEYSKIPNHWNGDQCGG